MRRGRTKSQMGNLESYLMIKITKRVNVTISIVCDESVPVSKTLYINMKWFD